MIALSIVLSLSLPIAAQDSYLEFRNQFKQAMEIKATSTMAQLVKRNQAEAVDWIMLTAETISINPSDEVYDRMNALETAWKTSMETEFASNMKEYFDLLEGSTKRDRAKFKQDYEKAKSKYWKNDKKKDGPTYVLLSRDLEALANSFAKIGDRYHASDCWTLYRMCFDEYNRGPYEEKGTRRYKVYKGASQCMAHREAIGLKDRIYLNNKQIADFLKANGYAKESSGEEGGEEAGPGAKPGAPMKPKASGAEIATPLEFEAMKDLGGFQRPSYFSDGLYPMWSVVYMGGKAGPGSKGKVVSLDKLSPTFYRTGASEVKIDTDGDGAGDKKVPLTGNMELIEFQIGDGDEKRDWACMSIVGMEQDLFQGFEQHLGVSDWGVSLYVFNAASVVGEVGGEKIQILDDNGDGVFGSPPKEWGHAGLTAGQMHPEMDCIRIGKSKRAQPWSEYQKVDDAWYRLIVGSKGDEIVSTPVTLETGTLKLKFKGGKPSWMVVQGKGKYEGCYYDLLAGGSKGVEVPVGSYDLYCGDLRKGKKRQTAKTLVLPGEDMESWTVVAGKTTTVELGGPFKLEFTFEMADPGVRVAGGTVVVVGEAGERYERPWNCRPAPDVYWRKIGSKKGNKAERMKLITDQYVMNEDKKGWSKVWFPLDCEFDVNNIEQVELQLTEKKNALFGKIESIWKE